MLSPAETEKEAAIARLDIHFYESLQVNPSNEDFELHGTAAHMMAELVFVREEMTRVAVAMECDPEEVMQNRAKEAVQWAFGPRLRVTESARYNLLNYIAEAPYIMAGDELGRELADLFYVAIQATLSVETNDCQ